jgi:hypothetical protein
MEWSLLHCRGTRVQWSSIFHNSVMFVRHNASPPFGRLVWVRSTVGPLIWL